MQGARSGQTQVHLEGSAAALTRNERAAMLRRAKSASASVLDELRSRSGQARSHNFEGGDMIDKQHIGRTTTPQTVDVEKGRLKFFAKAIGETNPIYIDEAAAKAAGYRALPAPPTFTFCLEMETNSLWDNIAAMGVPVGKILHGSQAFKYHAPICAGDRVTFQTKVSDIYDKKGGALEFIVEDTTAKNQDGVLVAELQRVIVVRN
jgi:acyl dehydratase